MPIISYAGITPAHNSGRGLGEYESFHLSAYDLKLTCNSNIQHPETDSNKSIHTLSFLKEGVAA